MASRKFAGSNTPGPDGKFHARRINGIGFEYRGYHLTRQLGGDYIVKTLDGHVIGGGSNLVSAQHAVDELIQRKDAYVAPLTRIGNVIREFFTFSPWRAA